MKAIRLFRWYWNLNVKIFNAIEGGIESVFKNEVVQAFAAVIWRVAIIALIFLIATGEIKFK